MSILIKGMEMPKDIEPGLVIEFANGIDGKRYARLYHYQYGGLTEWIEAIPVPEHGRLCNKDDVLKVIDNLIGRIANKEAYEALKWAKDCLSVLPTIIPADKEGEG